VGLMEREAAEMKCPHCLVEIHPEKHDGHIGQDADGQWFFETLLCPNPNCKRLIIFLLNQGKSILVRPRGVSRAPVPPEVPKEIAEDYTEACLVLADSPKASAALGRRCLQHLLREKAAVKQGDLADEIQQVIDSRQLPSHLSEAIDAVRNTGNFAAHPVKSKSTGGVVPVEPGEAEWNLDVLESLFDFYFVQPESLKQKRESLNKKLQDAGKPPMKGPTPPASAP